MTLRKREDMRELHLTDPAKIKAATTYNSAADHFDDGPLAFGIAMVAALLAGWISNVAPACSTLGVGRALRLYQPPRWLAQTEPS
jgi:hypothetical protein